MKKNTIEKQAEARMPTKWGEFQMIAFAKGEEMFPHLALVHGELSADEPMLVRLHSECMTGDLFGSLRCECGEQLEAALQKAAKGNGVIIYLRQEGRGIGLINKLKAYNLQDEGYNTVDANVHLGFQPDSRDYSVAIQILEELGLKKIRLMTNNPQKIEAFDEGPIEVVERVPLEITPKDENRHYLLTKKEQMGHMLDL
jgi:3,4-dihydroxy 2-butanone 4-phosphate synthase/GTP cyclohydrolase II